MTTMTMIQLRSKQALRMANELGLPHFLLLALMLTAFALLVWSATAEKGNAWLVLLAGLVSTTMLHYARSDRQFVVHSNPKAWQGFAMEYLLLLLPVWLSLIIRGNLLPLPLLLLLLPLSFYKAPVIRADTTRHKPFIRMLPDDALEWKGGIRRMYWFFMSVWLAGLAAALYLPALPLAVLLCGSLVINFYEKNEALPLLRSRELPAGMFLRSKMVLNTMLFTLLMLPHTLVFAWLHPAYWYVAPSLLALLLLLQSYAILVKYTFYNPLSTTPAGSFFQALGAVSAIVPFLLPLVIVLGIRFYFRALNNIKPLLNDFN